MNSLCMVVACEINGCLYTTWKITRPNKYMDPECDLTTRRALSHHEAPAFLIYRTSCLSSWNNLSHTVPFYRLTLVYTLQSNIYSTLLFTSHSNNCPTTPSPATRQ